jgi:hypothetical protein
LHHFELKLTACRFGGVMMLRECNVFRKVKGEKLDLAYLVTEDGVPAKQHCGPL